MRSQKILLVADRTAADSHVASAMRARAARGPVVVTLLVPATPARGGWSWEETDTRNQARQRMHDGAASLRRVGVHVAAVLGDFDPMNAIRDEMRRRDYDEIVISTLPTRLSRWLRADLPTRVAREFPVRVSHVRAAGEPTALAFAQHRSSAA